MIAAAHETTRFPRPGADRRAALLAVANMGHGGSRVERFRAVIYTTGIATPFAPGMDQLRSWVEGRYWSLAGTYFDQYIEVPATDRPGLQDAITAIKNGHATALVIDARSYDELTPTAREWLNSEIQRFGGFISPVGADDHSG